MAIFAETIFRSVEEVGEAWKEGAKLKWFLMCQRISLIAEMPEILDLKFSDDVRESGVHIPLMGGREMIFWVRNTRILCAENEARRRCVVTEMWVDDPHGNLVNDVILQDVKDRKFRIEDDPKNPLGLKFVARFDAERDIDRTGEENWSELQKKVAVALRDIGIDKKS